MKAKEKIKALYGVDIADKGVLQQIVDLAKSGFGGNLDGTEMGVLIDKTPETVAAV